MASIIAGLDSAVASVACAASSHGLSVPPELLETPCRVSVASVTSLLRICADALRTQLRDELGASGLPALCVQCAARDSELHDAAYAGLLSEALRTAANLCIDNSANRERLVALGAPHALVCAAARIERTHAPPYADATLRLFLAVFGAVHNLQMDLPAAQAALYAAGGAPLACRIGALAYSVGGGDGEGPGDVVLRATVAAWAWRGAQTIIPDGDDSGGKEDPTEWTSAEVHVIIAPLRTPWERSDRTCADEAVAAELAECDEMIVHAMAPVLCFFAQHAESFRTAAAAPGADAPLATLLASARTPARVPAYWSALEADVPADDPAAALRQLRQAVVQVVVEVAGEDKNAATLCPLGAGGTLDLSAFLQAVLGGVAQVEDAVWASCAMLSLGNLARDEPRCVALLREPELLPHIRMQLKKHAHDLPVAYAAVGLLKNLAIPDANKGPIAQSGLIPALIPMLARERDMAQPLQMGIAGLLKNVCAQAREPENALRVLGLDPVAPVPTDAVGALLALHRRSDQVPVRLETARVFVMLVRALFSASASSARAPQLTGQFGAHAVDGAFQRAREDVANAGVVAALCELLRHGRKYPVVMSEGLLALALLCSMPGMPEATALQLTARGDGARALPPTAAAADPLFAQAGDALRYVLEKMAPPVGGNLCTLLRLLYAAKGRMGAEATHGMVQLGAELAEPLESFQTRAPAAMQALVQATTQAVTQGEEGGRAH
ncbi:hypothetical protein MSPP1_000654 [Malassezia sp. CBS 17886]|nr:hypothetical protein MSPP1_000654 [Malassezia sp. CBS 17886]